MTDVKSRSWDPPAWATGALAAEFEPLPRIGVLQAARRHWMLVLLPILLLVPVVAVVASKRTPTYSAEARLMVGQLNISTPGAIAGYAQAAQDLAATYPLLIDTDGVVKPVARRLHVSPDEVLASISATEVPSSSVIRVDAASKSPIDAVKLANAASNSLVGYIAAAGRRDPTLRRLLAQVQNAELAYQKAQSKVPASGAPLTPEGQQLAVRAATARVQLDSIIQTYQAAVQNQTVSANLRTITYAAGASSDKGSKFQIAVFGALIAGLILGLALATLYANLAVRRALTVPPWNPPTQSLHDPDPPEATSATL